MRVLDTPTLLAAPLARPLLKHMETIISMDNTFSHIARYALSESCVLLLLVYFLCLYLSM